MKCFVTGVCGFLGSKIAADLVARGHKVAGCDNHIGGKRDRAPEGVAVVERDCRDWGPMSKLLRGVDVVWHAAACPHEGLSVFSPNVVVEHTLNSTIGVATAAANAGVGRVVYLSSMARYGNGDAPFHEGAVCTPADPYGAAKLAAEGFLHMLGRAHGFEVVVAVPHNVYGEGQKYWDPYRNVVGIFCNRLLQGKPPVIYGDGRQRRSFTHWSDAVEPVVAMGVTPGLAGRTFNVGSEQVASVEMVARLLAEILDVRLEPEFMPGRPCEVREAWCSCQRARRELGIKARVSLDEGLARAAAWVRSQGPRDFEYHLPIEIPSDRVPRVWKERLF